MMHHLFFLVFIYRVLNYLESENFAPLELVHITAPIGATFLKQRYAQRKLDEPSVSTSKRPRVDVVTATGDMSVKEIHIDLTTAMDLDTTDSKPNVPPPLSLRVMMEIFMMTQATHGQLLDKLLTEVATLRAGFSKSRCAFPPPTPFNS